ncbi:MAG: ABC transporter permease [bacterium]|nr:ABC transporter permease [bacterium]
MAPKPRQGRRRTDRAGGSRRDLIALAVGALAGHRLRTLLSMLGIAVGIASVILLTSIGEGTRVYIFSQFSQFGTHILIISPGKSKTVGFPGVLGGSTYHLTLDDAMAVGQLPEIAAVAPMVIGQARVEGGGRGRSVLVYGVTPEMPRVWLYRVRQGVFWSSRDPHRGASLAVLGPTLKRELFGHANALGEFVRIAGRRFRVVGVMEPKGRFLGLDIGDTVYIPVAVALQIFNLSELTEIDALYHPSAGVERTERAVRELLIRRHNDNEDFTVLTQQAMLEVFGNVMDVVTAAVGGIAGISLLVGAIGILTMMWIAVGERTSEIGLVRAIGATRGQVHFLFLAEAAALAVLGGLTGIGAGLGLCAVLRMAVPGLPITTPLSFVAASIGVSLVTGLASGVLPARRAAALDPIVALRAE